MDLPRRSVLKAGAWSAPIIITAIAVPSALASGDIVVTPRAVLAASFPGVVTQPGTYSINFELTNTSTTPTTALALDIVGVGANQITSVTAAGWSASRTTVGSGFTVTGNLLPAGQTVTFRLEVIVPDGVSGDILDAQVFEGVEVLAHATMAMSSTAVSGRPAVKRSYGPNGTHWPDHTPWLYEAVGTTIEVDCTWAAIAAAIQPLTADQVRLGVHIKVRPGTLPGEGISSSSKSMMPAVGNANWPRNVLVSPRDGRGTVTVAGADGARLTLVKGVTFARIDAKAIMLTNCSRTAWAQSKMSTGLRITSSYNTETRNCDAYEIVMADAKASIADPFGYAAGDNCYLTDSLWVGCYAAPVFRPTGATDHVDTLQMYGAGWYRGLTIRDSTFFGGKNCALQIGGTAADDPYTGKGLPFITVENSIVTSQATAIRVRYDVPTGAELPANDQAINGIGEDYQLYVRNSLIFGTIYTTKWGEVTNSKVSVKPGAKSLVAAGGGAWTVDTSMNAWSRGSLDGLTPTPTDAYLASIWT